MSFDLRWLPRGLLPGRRRVSGGGERISLLNKLALGCFQGRLPVGQFCRLLIPVGLGRVVLPLPVCRLICRAVCSFVELAGPLGQRVRLLLPGQPSRFLFLLEHVALGIDLVPLGGKSVRHFELSVVLRGAVDFPPSTFVRKPAALGVDFGPLRIESRRLRRGCRGRVLRRRFGPLDRCQPCGQGGLAIGQFLGVSFTG